MGRSPCRVPVGCCKYYRASRDNSRRSGSENLAGILERPREQEETSGYSDGIKR